MLVQYRQFSYSSHHAPSRCTITCMPSLAPRVPCTPPLYDTDPTCPGLVESATTFYRTRSTFFHCFLVFLNLYFLTLSRSALGFLSQREACSSHGVRLLKLVASKATANMTRESAGHGRCGGLVAAASVVHDMDVASVGHDVVV